MYDAIKAFPPDFALFTGDIVDHAIWNTSVERNSAEITMAYQQLRSVYPLFCISLPPILYLLILYFFFYI